MQITIEPNSFVDLDTVFTNPITADDVAFAEYSGSFKNKGVLWLYVSDTVPTTAEDCENGLFVSQDEESNRVVRQRKVKSGEKAYVANTGDDAIKVSVYTQNQG